VKLVRAIVFKPLLLAGAVVVLFGGAIFALADRRNSSALGLVGFAIAMPGAILSFVGYVGIGGGE
jgi:hypothetical protein